MMIVERHCISTMDFTGSYRSPKDFDGLILRQWKIKSQNIGNESITGKGLDGGSSGNDVVSM